MKVALLAAAGLFLVWHFFGQDEKRQVTAEVQPVSCAQIGACGWGGWEAMAQIAQR